MDGGRVKTYVEGLDAILGGGIPRGHLVLVTGMPGTMKSSLAYAILYHNALQGTGSGLYVSLEQGKGSLEKQMEAMGLADSVGGRLNILDVASIRKDVGQGKTGAWMEFLRHALDTRREMQRYDLLVLDSLEALEVLGRFQDPRADLFDFFERLREPGATSFVLTEASPEPILFPSDVGNRIDAGYLADGVIHLRMHQVNDVSIQRRLRIVKMRGTAHETGYLALVFDEGKFGVTPAMSV